MSPTAIALILVAAVAHATWNLCGKQAATAGAAGFAWLLSVLAAGLYAPVIAVAVIIERPHLTALNWVFMVGTGVLQAGYFIFLQNGYRLGDLSLVYPIGRGTGALLAAVAGIAFLGERPGAAGIAGIICIVAGVIVLGLPAPPRAAPQPEAQDPQTPAAPAVPMAVVLALGTGVLIAAYTLWDKHAVSTLHTPSLLQGYAAFPVMVIALAPPALRDRNRVLLVWRSYRLQLVIAAVLAPLAYILVLTALAFSSVAAIAPAREVSVLFGVVLGRRLLGEGSLPRRLAAAGVIVVGVIAVAIG